MLLGHTVVAASARLPRPAIVAHNPKQCLGIVALSWNLYSWRRRLGARRAKKEPRAVLASRCAYVRFHESERTTYFNPSSAISSSDRPIAASAWCTSPHRQRHRRRWRRLSPPGHPTKTTSMHLTLSPLSMSCVGIRITPTRMPQQYLGNSSNTSVSRAALPRNCSMSTLVARQ